MGRPTKYFVKNLGQKGAEATEVVVETLDDGRYAVTIDGQRTVVESLVLPHGAVSMIADGQSHSVEFDEKGDAVGVLLKGQLTRFDVADERKVRMRAATAAFSVEGKQQLTAPMPGKIVKIFVKVGDEVKEGQGVVVVEAMKMENELKAPKAGKVTEVQAKEGAAVENGAPLLTIE